MNMKCKKCGNEMLITIESKDYIFYKCKDKNCGHSTLIQKEAKIMPERPNFNDPTKK